MDPSPQPSIPRTVSSSVLLEGLSDPTPRPQGESLADRYRPLIVAYLESLGLAPPDADEVAGTSLAAFSTAWRQGRYERAEGRLADWLRAAVDEQVGAWWQLRRIAGQPLGSAAEQVARLPEPAERQRRWAAAWQDAVLCRCVAHVAQEVRPASYDAFRLYAVEGRPIDEVVARLGLPRATVYLVRRHILGRVRELRPQVEAAF